jgi:hypothetical protein
MLRLLKMRAVFMFQYPIGGESQKGLAPVTALLPTKIERRQLNFNALTLPKAVGLVVAPGQSSRCGGAIIGNAGARLRWAVLWLIGV